MYTNADDARFVTDKKSTSRYCLFLGGDLLTWKSKKQNVVSRSSVKAEFLAIGHGVCELLQLRIILNDLKVACEESIILYCDNKLAISIAHNLVQHDRTKHIEIDRHYNKEKLDSDLITTYVMSHLGFSSQIYYQKVFPLNEFMISHASWE